MSPEEIRELWSRFLSEETLSAGAQRELIQALDGDSELRESLLENLQLDGMLRAMGTTRRHGEAFVRTMTECVGAERDATQFVQKVELRLNEPEPPAPKGAGTGTGRRVKPPTTRVFRRRAAAPIEGETAWKPALIAAAAILAILFLVTSEKPVPTDPAITQAKPVTIPEPAPLPPPPLPSAEEARRPKTEPQVPSPLVPPRFSEPKPEAPRKPPSPEKPRRPDPPRQPEGKTETAVLPAEQPVPATLDRVQLFVFTGPNNSNMVPAKKEDKVPPGHEVRTKAASSAVLVYEDQTVVELGANSSLREELPLAGQRRGRRVVLAYGSLESHITKQPADRPMVFASPAAEATIVGTTVRLTVSHDPKIGTTLEVKEGKVLFARVSDRKPVEVKAGQFAVAAEGAELKPLKMFPNNLLVKFGPSDVQVKPGQVLDSGEEFEPGRGYGWLGRKDGDLLPGVTWRNPNNGTVEQKRKGRYPVRRTPAPPNADPLKTTDVVAGWGPHSETWIMPVPNGRYRVTVCCGDITFEQGPHHVAVEGLQVIHATKNRAGQFIERQAVVEVKDGELTMKVGGYAGAKVSVDGSSDTILNYLIIERLKK